MIREAKGIAIHDLSFWSTTLPLLDGFPRIIGDYHVAFGDGLQLELDRESGTVLHQMTLDAVAELLAEPERTSFPASATPPPEPPNPFGPIGEASDPSAQAADFEHEDGLTYDWEAMQLAREMVSFLETHVGRDEARTNVPIRGCGVVVGGECDLLWPPRVVELKLTASQPSLRDIRQVLVYAGLLRIAGDSSSELGVVINPRLGLAAQFELDEVLLLTGGLTLDEFAIRLEQFLTDPTQSN